MAQLHTHLTTVRRDAQILVSHPTHQVEGLARRPLQRQLTRVRGHVALHRLAQMRCREKETIRWHLAVDGLARPLEVVPVDKQLYPTDAVVEVDEDRPREKLVPERLPPPLDLSQGLRMLRPARHVHDAQRAQLLLEVRLAPPRRVLPALVREDVSRTPVRRHRSTQCLHHQRALLMMREHVADHVSRVVVHKAHHVQPLVLAQKKGEDIAHPHLVRARALESPRRVLPRRLRCLPLDQTLSVQDPPDLRLADTQSLEARQHVADPPCPVIRVIRPELDHGLLLLFCCLAGLLRAATASLLRHQGCGPALLVLRDPRFDRRRARPKRLRHVGYRQAVLEHCLNGTHAHWQRVGLCARPPGTRPFLSGFRAPPRGGIGGVSRSCHHTVSPFRGLVSPVSKRRCLVITQSSKRSITGTPRRFAVKWL